MKLLERFDVLLLDMNSTFMFGEDRFGPDEDFHATYRSVGGRRLSSAEVTATIRACYEGLVQESRAAENYDHFSSVVEGLRRYARVADHDIESLEAVFAAHELGSVPPAYAELLRRLSRTHQLGLVSNIWARKPPWLAEFQRAGISDVFRVTVFSSDTRSIKPSPALFQLALREFPPGSRTLFIGDSLKRDITPAKALGLHTAWISATGHSPLADYILPDLLAIESARVA